ncbi:ComEC/Rec2 family competence protein [Sphingomonas sp.]|uniref:ComEC/Rec2 family competence protein n=1 Tax=Sphingomonas sp. TaxID=28214 RepID=UPI001DC05562|nr:ComEC/Rec2 family competence protein [Sphingomonas sp.]MBX9796141.1 ComEC/Rec2 family competence protein [Sphingomonas sp.]
MARIGGTASSTQIAPLQIAAGGWSRAAAAGLEHWLEGEADQLFLWVPVALGGGIALWFVLPGPRDWALALLGLLALASAAIAGFRGGRGARAVALGAGLAALGLALIWLRAGAVAAPVLARPVVVTMTAQVERVEPLPPRGLVRLTLLPQAAEVPGGAAIALPARVRVNLDIADAPADLRAGAVLRLGARLLPPPGPALPGAYDYARIAWFAGIGATGRGFGPIELLRAGPAGGELRRALSAHIQARLEGSAGGIAAALATGDQGAITADDAEAMRRSGLAHLLSVSGLHITAVVGAVMLAVLRLLALSPWLATRVRLPLVAAGAAALAAIGYTVLTGAEVPTVRSCVAALLVLVALAAGRAAMTLRLVAAGAIAVLLLWPEALAGPSFQLSFAAVATIVALGEAAPFRALLAPREEGWGRWAARRLAALLITGLVVEAALAPIALYHFHKAGIYGALANIVAIPLTTFVIMPVEALALLADLPGLGAPFWALAWVALEALLWIARTTAAVPGAVALLPAMPTGAFALIVLGGLWLVLWRTRWRLLGAAPIMAGALWAVLTPAPDLLVTGDGRHVAVRLADGRLAMLRERAGDYVQSVLAENGGVDGAPWLIDGADDARCSRDLCLIERVAGGRRWRILATRSLDRVPITPLLAACAAADIAISERRLPRRCTPRWLKLDRAALSATGGVAITLASGRVTAVNRPGDAHPWRRPPLLPGRPRDQ